jgi:hypothetical protein
LTHDSTNDDCFGDKLSAASWMWRGAKGRRNADGIGANLQRWERFAAAAARMPVAERMAFIDESDSRAKNLKVTDYEVVRIAPMSERIAKVQVRMSWYLETEGALRETHSVQTWKQTGKVWVLVGQARLRGPVMPGLAEAQEPAALVMDPPSASSQP